MANRKNTASKMSGKRARTASHKKASSPLRTLRLEVVTSLESRGSAGSGAPGSVEVHLVSRSESTLLSTSCAGAELEHLKADSAFEGKYKQLLWIRQGGKTLKHALFAGMGNLKEWTPEKARILGALVAARLSSEKIKSAVVYGDALDPVSLAALAEGAALACYQYKKYHSKAEPVSLQSFTLALEDESTAERVEEQLERVRAAVESIFLARDWSNEPPNHGTPAYFASEALVAAKRHGLKARVLGERECRALKMDLFLAVGQGSEQEAKMVVVEYDPRNAGRTRRAAGRSPKTVAFVGKGVTFDTGGICIKPSARMEEMKHDMSGAATVFAACVLAARWKVPNRVVGVMVFTENSPSGTAILPGSVVRARNGKTVEIINTDAEGRLILADALDYVQDFKPDCVIDAATLTGAIGVALGRFTAGMFVNQPHLLEQLTRAAELQGERVWNMPLFDEYFDDMKSEYADIKNISSDGQAGASRGAIFLKQFVRDGMPWAHLDIASTAWDMGFLPYNPKKGGSGAHVRMLAQFAEDYS